MIDCYYQGRKQEKGEAHEVEEEYTDPYTMFVYAIRSPYTKESYFGRLRRFFESIDYAKGRVWRNVVMHCVQG